MIMNLQRFLHSRICLKIFLKIVEFVFATIFKLNMSMIKYN